MKIFDFGLAKKFVQVSLKILGKNLNELFGQPNIITFQFQY